VRKREIVASARDDGDPKSAMATGQLAQVFQIRDPIVVADE